MSILSDRKRSVGLRPSVMAVTIIMTVMLVLPLAGVQVRAEQGNDSSKEQILPDPDEFIPVDESPEMIYSEAPTYPELARKAGVQGAVWIKALVDTNGKVVKAIVYKSSGFKSLDDAALDVADKNRYKPATLGGDPVMVWISYKVNFQLDFGEGTKDESEG